IVGRLVVAAAGFSVEARQHRARDELPIRRIRVELVALAFERHAVGNWPVFLLPKVAVLQHVAPLVASVRVRLIDADHDVADRRHALVARELRVVRLLALFPLSFRAVRVEGQLLALGPRHMAFAETTVAAVAEAEPLNERYEFFE